MLDSIMLVGGFCFLFSLIICLIIAGVFTSWFAAIVVVVYVGGLLVIFSYFLAVFPNQTVNRRYGVFSFSLVIPIIILFFDANIFYCPVNFGGLSRVDYLFRSDRSFFIFFVFFLLICLFCVVSIVQLCEGPLRPFSG